MQVQILAIPSVEADGPRYTGPLVSGAGELAFASDALLAAGLESKVEQLGVEVRGVSRIELPGADRTGDPVVDLGLLCALVAHEVSSALADAAIPVLAGGVCGHAPGIVAGIQLEFGADARIGIIWFDAHGDFNTSQSSRSGLLVGMPLAVCAGLGNGTWRELAGIKAPVPLNRILLVDARDLDPFEQSLVAETELARVELTDDAQFAISELAERVDHLYVHVDIDILSERYLPNAPLNAPGGVELDALAGGLRHAIGTGKVRSFAVVAVNPSEPGGLVSISSAMSLLLAGIDSLAST